ncbi:tRNA glutamyl-Q(34) synthetase GluQRS [Ponticoccus alexandrii]|uniref:tRNA glutamyl-Q(34) synthetase GluQRS n=1 Tax=Ponticoccus alexandrii TaxID=1943633 RepID=A0ABX7F852_9RHOB|nr:tRNA glutamyl-Q(34) synthetase GluQRS [Ponticoccus alexandrii]ETA51620.1 glutamyl-tRNA synthetase [Rhodobacteraceae bacterium PD-2]QRF66664.1 tRNA glutamyl-Q(34) synthetase GluQRS [Ponticoccus alexandrii]
MTFRTRFAPSPTGPLHLGHAFSALTAFDMAQAAGGTFLLRIEDIDSTRSRPEWERQIHDDLHWLGLDWPEPALRQSDRLPAYRAALDSLWSQGLLYACRCSRRDIAEAASAPQEGAPLIGPDGPVYPGTCRGKPRSGPLPEGALRLDMTRAMERLGPADITFTETGARAAPQITARGMIDTVGDIVLSRRDFPGSYHLSVVLDDAAQKITHVVRGEDLFDATPIHVVLQRLLGLPTPGYHHHRLIRDEHGKRLAKRDDARALATYQAEGATPQDIRAMVGL